VSNHFQQAHAAAAIDVVAAMHAPTYTFEHIFPLKPRERIRVGYVSSDFKVSSHQMAWSA
jgi:predicted O-linked N-acetylglucosamine transferase (SPINDLY family)